MNMLTSALALFVTIIFQSYNLPRAYQHLGTLHDANYNISADRPREPFGNGNKEFPWDKPGGLQSSGYSIKSVYFSGPVVYYNSKKFKGLVRWVFSPGTIFKEHLYLDSGQLFMIRTRTKIHDGWTFSVQQPFNSLNELNKRLKWLSLPIVTATSIHYDLLTVNLSKILNILEHNWEESFGSTWYGIHPKDSNLEITQNNCVQCHINTAVSVKALSSNRHWYGHIRGDDGIFSWYPFKVTSISHNGASKKLTLDHETWSLIKWAGQKGYVQTSGFK